MDHGHALLLRTLREQHPDWVRRRGVRMLEIGTTREALPNQDSTRVLSGFCRDHGWTFTTCDMDPANTARAAAMFTKMGVGFTAVTARGEEYVASGHDRFDVVYLDAYDFDHGKHSEQRQQRYEEFLGARIDQQACEIMHLETIKGLSRSGARRCLVVIDDTWRADVDSPWQGKGPLAIPWALANGWEIVMEHEDYRAVSLQKLPALPRLGKRVLTGLRLR